MSGWELNPIPPVAIEPMLSRACVKTYLKRVA